jgi:thioredoxin
VDARALRAHSSAFEGTQADNEHSPPRCFSTMAISRPASPTRPRTDLPGRAGAHDRYAHLGHGRTQVATVHCMDVTDETFEREVIARSQELPVVVDFWADWCGPCKILAPVLERAVAERDGQVALAKLDVDANQETASRFGIRSIPAVKAFRGGHVVAEFLGAQRPTAVSAFLDQLTGPSAAEQLLSELEARGELPEIVAAARAGDYEDAFEAILEEIAAAAGDGERRTELRELAVALFQELGQEHPLSLQYRRRLATALY